MMDPRMMGPGGPMDPRMMGPGGMEPRMMGPGGMGPMGGPGGPMGKNFDYYMNRYLFSCCHNLLSGFMTNFFLLFRTR